MNTYIYGKSEGYTFHVRNKVVLDIIVIIIVLNSIIMVL